MRHLHLCQDIRGALRNWRFPADYAGVFKHADGSPATPTEARDYLLDQLSQGKDVLPLDRGCTPDCKRPGCTGFSFKNGCPGWDPNLTTERASYEEFVPC